MFNMCRNLLLKSLSFSFTFIFRLPNSLSNMVGVLTSEIFSRNMHLNIPRFRMELTGRMWYPTVARPSKVHGNSQHVTSSYHTSSVCSYRWKFSKWYFAFTTLLGSYFVRIIFKRFIIMWKAPRRANGTWIIHSNF